MIENKKIASTTNYELRVSVCVVSHSECALVSLYVNYVEVDWHLTDCCNILSDFVGRAVVSSQRRHHLSIYLHANACGTASGAPRTEVHDKGCNHSALDARSAFLGWIVPYKDNGATGSTPAFVSLVQPLLRKPREA